MKFRNLAAGLAGLLFVALTAFAQITAIEGDVKGVDGNPVRGAVIKIVRTDIKGNYVVKVIKRATTFTMACPWGRTTFLVRSTANRLTK